VIKKILIIFFIFLSSCEDDISNVKATMIKNEKVTIYLEGRFTRYTYADLQVTYKMYSNYDFIIYANSIGGYAGDILKIMDLVHSHGKTTFVVDDDHKCKSACALMGISAKSVKGILSFHASHYSNQENAYKTIDKKSNAEVKQKLKEFGVNERFADLFTSKLEFTHVKFDD
jgi:hypothetical protein